MSKITISTTIDILLHSKAQERIIPWSDALEFGIKFFLAERGEEEYPSCKLTNKMLKFKELTETLSEENFKLKEQLGIKEKTIEEEALNIMGVKDDRERVQ